jgi:hypothetical protein
MPFVASDGLAAAARRCLLLALLNGVYYLRAKTEERHLSADPIYVDYAAWIKSNGALRFLGRVPRVGAIACWHPSMQLRGGAT